MLNAEHTMGTNSMSEHKYEEFYLLNDCKEHPVYILQYVSDEEYIRKYDGNMYCPLCKKAQLSRVRGKSVFLRTNPGQEHGMIDGETCDYAFDRKSITETEKIIKDLEENNQLGTKLDSIMLQLIKRTTNTAVAVQVQEESRPPITKSKSTGTRNITRTIVPRYSFLNWGITTPQDHLIIAYGRVYVTNKQSKEGYKFLNLFADISKRRLLTSFFKPTHVNIEDGYYNVVAVGTCIQNGKYYNFKLFDSYNGLRIKAINE